MDTMNENCIEFLRNQDRATVTVSQGRFITRVRKLAKQRPEDCQIAEVNEDGSIVAHLPVAWIKINPTMQLTEEERIRRSERGKNSISNTR